MLVPLTTADEQCGAKAANLAHLLRAGFDVPPGFVVLEVLGGDSWVPELRAALRDAGAASVAVRSSAVGEDGANASFAGQLRSALDLTEPAQVIDQVRRAARSGVGPEAVAYAARMGREPATVVPVIVQALVPAEVAGVMGPGDRHTSQPGTAEGFVRIVHGFDDFARFEAGEVLVCRTTSPAWTPLLARAAAVVTEIGGLLAHAAIVAREFGIPAVLAAEKAMSMLSDGQYVIVDGTAGTITTTQASGAQ